MTSDLDRIIDKLIRAQGALSRVATVGRDDRDRLVFALDQIGDLVEELHAQRQASDAS